MCIRDSLGAAPDDPGPWAVHGLADQSGTAPVVAIYVDHKGSTLKPEVVLVVE